MLDQPALVTIHGINSNGAWQSTLRSVFMPHFRYRAITYPHYRWLGGTKVLVEPWFLTIIATAVAGGLALGLPRPGSFFAAGAIVVVALIGHLLAAIRRRLAFVAVLRQFDEHVAVGEQPSCIAHSFGTYLFGRILMERPTVRCSQVIFAGSVLARSFPSQLLRSRTLMPFDELRNEIGSSDPVVWAAGLARRLVRHLGNAGLRGFQPLEERVHEVNGPGQRCPTCSTSGPPVPWAIHNVRIKAFAHSDQFITPRHAVQYWLPALWNIDVPEFGDWLSLCMLASFAGRPSVHAPKALQAEQTILERNWSWAGSTIESFIGSEYPDVGKAMQEDPVQALRVYRAIWLAVSRACENAETHGDDPEKIAFARALDPRIAVQVAVGVVA